jgi:DNA-binding transcriptional regulator YiaG
LDLSMDYATPHLVRIRDLCQSGEARRIRIAAGVSQTEIADDIGDVTPAAVHRWETGGRRPHGKPALRYLELLDILAATREGGGRTNPCPHGRPSWGMCPHCLGVNGNTTITNTAVDE